MQNENLLQTKKPRGLSSRRQTKSTRFISAIRISLSTNGGNCHHGRRLRGQRGTVPSKLLGGMGMELPISSPKFQKYLIKYKFLQCFLLFEYCLLRCVHRPISKVTILPVRGKLPIIAFPFVQTLKTLIGTSLKCNVKKHIFSTCPPKLRIFCPLLPTQYQTSTYDSHYQHPVWQPFFHSLHAVIFLLRSDRPQRE